MYIDVDKYLSHIQDSDKRDKMRRVIDKVEMVSRNYFQESTDFLDPYERRLAKSILNSFDQLAYLEDGGLEEAERKIISIYPDYMVDIEEEIQVLRLRGNIEDLNHQDFLGALMNLGIVRDKIGDILVYEEHVDIITKREVSDFVQLNLDKVGRQNMDIEFVSREELEPVELEFEEIFRIVSSLRLDSYLSATYNLSRNNSMKLIKSGRVRVNWEAVDKASLELEEGDTISTRGYGRSILYKVGGLTKKDNIKIDIRKLI